MTDGIVGASYTLHLPCMYVSGGSIGSGAPAGRARRRSDAACCDSDRSIWISTVRAGPPGCYTVRVLVLQRRARVCTRRSNGELVIEAAGQALTSQRTFGAVSDRSGDARTHASLVSSPRERQIPKFPNGSKLPGVGMAVKMNSSGTDAHVY